MPLPLYQRPSKIRRISITLRRFSAFGVPDPVLFDGEPDQAVFVYGLNFLGGEFRKLLLVWCHGVGFCLAWLGKLLAYGRGECFSLGRAYASL